MKTFRVSLAGSSTISATVYIESENEENAREVAIAASLEDADWRSEITDVEVESVEEVK